MVVLVETCQDYNLVRVDHGGSRAAGPFPPLNRRRGGGTSLIVVEERDIQDMITQ